MKIVAKVNKEDFNLLETLVKQGLSAKMVKGGIIVELPKKRNWNDKDSYEIPSALNKNNAILLINCEESGGALTKSGGATIVCGLSGKPLKPYYIPKSGHLACGTHAYFSVPNAVVTITAGRRSEIITIIEHRIVRERNVARIQSKELWSGRYNELPKTFARFEMAVKAAWEKANCYHCRRPHYIEKDK